MKNKDGLINHLETNFGMIQSGHRVSHECGDFSVAHSSDSPREGCCTVFSVGLSIYIGCEVSVVCKTTDVIEAVDITEFLSCYLLDTDLRPELSEIIGDLGFEIPGAKDKFAFYFTAPILHGEAACCMTSGIKIFWAIPISRREKLFIEKRGVESFNSLLESDKTDLTDFGRDSLC